MQALRVLILTPRIPYPLKDGGALAMHQSIEGYLSQGCEVSVLSINTSRHWVDPSTLPAIYDQLAHFETVFVKTNINPLSAFFNLFTDKSYNIERFVNKQVEQTLIRMLQTAEYDIIQFESIYVSPYLKTVRQFAPGSRCLCRVHNIEHLIWQRLTEHERSFIKRKYLKLLTSRLRQYELDILRKFDLLLPISVREMEFLQTQEAAPAHHLPFGVNTGPIPEHPEAPLASCYHIGSMDWAPNLEGIEWLLDSVWPKVQEKLPAVALYLAGKQMPSRFIARATEMIHIQEEVDDVIQFSLTHNLMLVPLLSGAGVRIKILEGMSLGKTIISTSIGAEGIGATDHVNIMLADTPEAFVEAIAFCLDQPDKAAEMGKQARNFVLKHYRKEEIYYTLIQVLQQI